MSERFIFHVFNEIAEAVRGRTVFVDSNDLNPQILLEHIDSYNNDDVDENAVDSTVDNANADGDADDDAEAEAEAEAEDYDQMEEEDSMTMAQSTVETKPNLTYGFRDRNSAIFHRRRTAINALLRAESNEQQRQRQRPRPRPNPRKRKPLEKKHKCNQCTYATVSSSRLKEHRVVHTKEKPFKCDVCQESMSYRHSLKQHSLRRHGIVLLN